MGAATSVLAGYTCHTCSMNFSIDPEGEHAARGGGVVCPRCGGPAERRAAATTGTPQIVVTPSGLVMTEDTLRQLLMTQLSPAPGAQPEQVAGAIDAMLRGLRQARDGDGVDATLLEVISRSIAEAQSQQAPPTSTRVLANLPKRKWTATQGTAGDGQAGDECAICLSAYQEGDDMSVLPCKHQLHTECLTPWLKQTNSCPLCRYQLDTDSAEYEARRRQQGGQPASPASHRPRPSPIQTDRVTSPAAATPAGAAGTARSGAAEFGVHTRESEATSAAAAAGQAWFSSPSTAGSGAGASPASGRQASLSGLRRGFLQDRGSRGFGEAGSSPQQAAAAASLAGIRGLRQVLREDIRGGGGDPALATPGSDAGSSRMLRMPGVPDTPAGAGRPRDDEGTGSGRVDPRSWSVRKLKGVLRNAHVAHQDCLEKEDLVQRCLECRLDLAASEREYDARLAAAGPDVGATRVPRQSMAAGGSGGAARRPNPRAWSPTTSAAASVLSNDWLSGSAGGSAASAASPLAGMALLSTSPNAPRLDSLAGRTPGQPCVCFRVLAAVDTHKASVCVGAVGPHGNCF